MVEKCPVVSTWFPIVAGLLLTVCLPSCSLRQGLVGRQLEKSVRRSSVFEKSLTGFVLMEPASGKVLSAVNSHKHFIPASNTKLLTLYTAFHLLGDSLPRLRYRVNATDSSVLIAGTGDPTLLHPDFAAWAYTTNPVISGAPSGRLYYQSMAGANMLPRWGNGWAWDDFGEAYSAEVSDLPVYGHILQLYVSKDGLRFSPEAYPPVTGGRRRQSAPYRHHLDAAIDLPDLTLLSPDTMLQLSIPMFHPSDSSRRLLAEAWACSISDTSASFPLVHKWYVTPVDTVYRKMMIESDNFLAEQLLIACSGEKFDSLSVSAAIQWASDSLFRDLPDPIRWVDGSGLSRYNLNTPANLAILLKKLWDERSDDHLMSFFPAGGISGTLRGQYNGSDGMPFVFAKSGSMSGVYCLSGYIRTKKGRWFIFSFMNNHFIGSNKPWKDEIERMLTLVYRRL